MAIPEVEETDPGCYMPSLLKERCVGSKGFWTVGNRLTDQPRPRRSLSSRMGTEACQAAAGLEHHGQVSLFVDRCSLKRFDPDV